MDELGAGSWVRQAASWKLGELGELEAAPAAAWMDGELGSWGYQLLGTTEPYYPLSAATCI